MNRRQFLTGGVAVMSTVPGSAAQSKPNIVFLMLDDLGTFDLGCYGQAHIQTPHIDSIAADGMQFLNAYAGAAVCAPSRAALMSGLHGGHAAVRANAGTIPLLEGDTTVASLLKNAGYATGAFGKWGLGDARSSGVPSKHGFDEFFGYLHQVHAHSYYPDFLWHNDQRIALNKGEYSADVIADQSLEFIRKHRGSPFFLYAAWTLPHGRFEIPDLGVYSKKKWPEGHKTYAAMVSRADMHIGRVLGLLKNLGLENNTVVVVTSDNGAPAGSDHGYEFFRSNGILRGDKGTVYEGGIRIPLLVRWPGRVKAGTVSRYPTAFFDVLPSLAEVAGVQVPGKVDGISIVPELTRKGQPQRDFLYWEHNVYDQQSGRLREESLLQAVRYGRWKAVRTKPGAPLELYDLAQDPGETADIAAKHADVVAKIEAYLRTARTSPRPHNTGSMQWVK